MRETVKKGILAGIGLVDLSVEMARSAIEALVKSGQMTAEEGRKAVEKLSERGSRESEEFRKELECRVSRVLEKMNLAPLSRFADLEARVVKMEEALELRISRLERDVDDLMNRRTPGP